MKKTYLKSMLRSIKSSFSRFAAIFAITALGVGFLAGLMSTTPDMRRTIDHYYDSHDMMDIYLKSTYGFNDDDIAAVRNTAGVADAMPHYVTDVMVKSADDSMVARIYGCDYDRLNIGKLTLIDGRYPEKADEVLCEEGNGITASLEIGDKVTITGDAGDTLSDTYSETELTVVGIVMNPYYMSAEREGSTKGNGRVGVLLYGTEELYLPLGVYTDIYVTAEGAKELDTYSDQYDELIADLTAALEATGKDRAEIRFSEIKSEAEEKLADAENEYRTEREKAEKELADAEKKLEDAKAELDDGKAQIADAKETLAEKKRELSDGRTQLENAKKELSDNEKKLSDSESTLADSKKQLDEADAQLKKKESELEANRTQLEASWKQLGAAETELAAQKASLEDTKKLLGEDDPRVTAAEAQIAQYEAQLSANRSSLETAQAQFDDGEAQLKSARAALEENRAELTSGQNELASAKKKIADAKNEIAENERKLSDGEKAISDAETEISGNEKKIADGEKEYADGLADYNEAKETADREFADAERKINDAKDEISKLEKPEWYVLDRSKTVSYSSFDSNADKIAAIAKVFPLFFFLVAALVAQTTMTRLIEEERGQIGILKALGYSKSDIMMKYVIYAGIPGIFGSACGLAAGLFVFPSVVWNAYKIMYRFPTLEYSFIPSIALGASAAAVSCILLSTVWAGAHSLAETPAALLLPRAPKAGKRVLLERVGFIWKRLGFNSKVTIRNIFRYKKRFFMTTIGIGGCTALLLTGFGLRNSIGDIVSNQFEDLMRYNLTIDLNSQTEDLDRLDAFLTSDRTDGSTLIHSEYGKVISGKDTVEAYFRVPELADDYADFQILRERKSRKPLTLDDDSVILTEKMASILGVSVGDNVTLENEDGLTADFRVGGIAENYVMSYVYMTSDLYTSGFGTEPDYNVVLVKSNADAAGEDAETEELLGMKCVSSVSFTTSMSSSFENMLGKIDYIVIVLIISAGALVFVVLYNLTNINIAERSKELATIKVLGFFDGEVAGYVYREIAALSVIGTLFGLFAGIFLHKFVVVTAEVDSFMFGRSIYPSSFLISALVTLVFSALVCLFMLKKLNGIDMVESMKGGE